MTPGSRWRLDLAHRLAPYITVHPDVRALVVGGSVCRGVADQYADLELGVYWAQPPSEDDRRAVHRAIAGTSDLFEPFPAAEDRYEADEDTCICGATAAAVSK